MKQIKCEKELIGKTITRIEYASMGKRLVLFFGDEYAVYDSVPGYESGDEEIWFYDVPLDEHELLELSLISREEHDAPLKNGGN